MAAYCRQHGLSYWMFIRWRQRLAAKATPTVPLTLIPVVTPRASGAALTIRLPDGIGIEVAPGFDAGVLSAVVRALQVSASC
jgi:hypothetical protein